MLGNKIVFSCGYAKNKNEGNFRIPRSKCFHNGIILIVNCFKSVNANIELFFENTIFFQKKHLSLQN